MVKMHQAGSWSALMIDLIGGCTVTACLLCFVWLIAIGADRTSDRIEQHRAVMHNARRQLTNARLERDRQRAIIETRQAQLARCGQLPKEAPVEEYFQTLANLATRHRLQVLRHHPLTSRSYPGLLERRYAYEVTGATPDLVLFFKAIEAADYWADVSYLKIDGGLRATGTSVRRSGSAGSAKRVAQLTISVFSALQSDGASSSG